jgi:hypothetical protein
MGIGGLQSAENYFPGYVSNLRFVKGVAVYSGNFTPPTSPLQRTQAGNGGTIQAITGTQTSLLTCQSNRFIDNGIANSGQPFTITVNGTPRVQAFQPFSPTASYTTALYGGSGYFGGSDSLSAPSNAAFAFGTGDFTIETWVYISNFSNFRGIFDSRASGSATGLALYTDLSGFLNVATTVNIATASKAIIANAWSHCALTRSGTSLTIWLNGENVSTITNSTNFSNQDCAIFLSMLGYISNFRIVKGTVVYTGNFTPPTLAPLATTGPASSASYSSTTNVNTTFLTPASLLLNMTNAAIYDAAVQNNVTTVGDAQASSAITAQWPPTSIRFDGTGDFLAMPLTPEITITSGSFTIEFWLNPTAGGPTLQAIVGTREGDLANNTNWTVSLVSNQLFFSAVSTSNTMMGTITHQTTLSAGTWYYCAVTRNGSTFTLYVNSVASSSTITSSATIQQSGTTLRVGQFGGSTAYSALNGYIQDLRITRGVARTITASPTLAFQTK